MFYILRHLQGRKLLEKNAGNFGKSFKRNLTKNKTAPAATGTVQVTFRRMIHQFNKNIVSPSGSLRKRNTRSMLAVIFVPIFTYHTKGR